MEIPHLGFDSRRLLGAIARRKSSRTFNGLKIDQSALAALESDIKALTPLLPGVELPVIRIIESDSAPGKLGTYGFITGARQFLAMASAGGDAPRVQAGYMFELLVLAATDRGLGTCWLGGTFRQGRFAEAMGDCGDREVVIVSPVGHATQKMRFAERMMRRVVKSAVRRPFETLFSGVAPDTAVGRILEAVRLAPSSTNSQPWRAEVSTAGGTLSVKFSCATSNAFSAIDMGIAYAHFAVASEAEGLAWEIADSGSPLGLTFRLASK